KLSLIREEAKKGFSDYRGSYKEPNAKELFYFFIGESPYTFREGMLVTVRVLAATSGGLRCILDNNLPGFLPADKLSKNVNSKLDELKQKYDKIQYQDESYKLSRKDILLQELGNLVAIECRIIEIVNTDTEQTNNTNKKAFKS